MTLYLDGQPTIIEPNIINELLRGNLDWRKLLGGEMVTNGSFTGNATGWTLGAGWTYNANAVDRDGAGTATMTQATVVPVAGGIYKVVYTISAYTDGSVTVSIGGTSGTARSSAATFTEYIKAADATVLTFTPTAASTFTIDNVSVKKVGYVAADGVTAWIEDRGATAGKGALHLVTEDGTGHVFGDRVGIGTLYPTAAFNVAVAAVFDSTLLFGSATAYVSGLLEINKSNAAVITGLNVWNDGDTPSISYYNRSGTQTIGQYTIVATGHLVHRDIYQGADGTDFQPAAEQEWSFTGTIGNNRVPGKYIVYLYTDAATSVKTAVITATAALVTFGTAITVGGDISMGANKLKTTNLVFKEHPTDTNALAVYNSGETSILDFYARQLFFTNLVGRDGTETLDTKNADDATITMRARDNGVGIVEICKWVGAADPYLRIGRDDTGVSLNTVTDMLVLQAGGGTGNEAANFGLGISMKIGNAASEVEERGSLDLVLVTATNGAEDVRLDFNLMAAGAMNLAAQLSGAGILDVDLSSGLGAATVGLFDDYDDAIVLRQGISQRQLGVLEKIGIIRKKQGGSGWFMNVQAMIYLLAGGIYQTREKLDILSDKVDRLNLLKA